MAQMFIGVCVAVMLLMCIHGDQAQDLLKVNVSSGDPPFIPQVNCWSPSYPNKTFCTWFEHPHFPPLHYNATYSEDNREAVNMQCHLISSEQLWHCQLPTQKLLTKYLVNVTAFFSSGTGSQLIKFMPEDIVKPDPPADVQVSPTNSKELLVKWSPPPTWDNLHIFPLKYYVMYQWEKCPKIRKSITLGPFENTSVEQNLNGLTPGREYQYQVCAEEIMGLGTCSNWTSPVNITIPRTKP